MHDHHGHHHHHHDREEPETEVLRKLLVMLDHWIEHDDSHAAAYREWAGKADVAGEESVAQEIHLAVGASDEVRSHLKRAKAVLAAKLVLRK